MLWLAVTLGNKLAPGPYERFVHAAHLPAPKSLVAKSCASTSSKLIETKGLQLHYFGHLRKTGGRGSYRLVHTPDLPVPKSLSAKSNYSGHPTKDVHPEPAEGLFSRSELSTFNFKLSTSPLNPFPSHHSRTRACNPFPLISLHKTGGIPLAWSYQVSSLLRHLGVSIFRMSLSSHSTPRLLRHPFPERNLPMSPEFQGARPAGMSSFACRCPDGHD